jgi:hypothetical protein
MNLDIHDEKPMRSIMKFIKLEAEVRIYINIEQPRRETEDSLAEEPGEGAGAASGGPVGESRKDSSDLPRGSGSEGKQWTARDDMQLRAWRDAGLGQKDIARQMGWSKKVIRTQLERLGLPTSRQYAAQSKRRGLNSKP